MGYSIHAGMVIVADGTPEADARLQRVLTTDPGMGVVRHADAGYERAIEVARERGVRIPCRRAHLRSRCASARTSSQAVLSRAAGARCRGRRCCSGPPGAGKTTLLRAARQARSRPRAGSRGLPGPDGRRPRARNASWPQRSRRCRPTVSARGWPRPRRSAAWPPPAASVAATRSPRSFASGRRSRPRPVGPSRWSWTKPPRSARWPTSPACGWCTSRSPSALVAAPRRHLPRHLVPDPGAPPLAHFEHVAAPAAFAGGGRGAAPAGPAHRGRARASASDGLDTCGRSRRAGVTGDDAGRGVGARDGRRRAAGVGLPPHLRDPAPAQPRLRHLQGGAGRGGPRGGTEPHGPGGAPGPHAGRGARLPAAGCVGVDALRMDGKRYVYVDGLLRWWVQAVRRAARSPTPPRSSAGPARSWSRERSPPRPRCRNRRRPPSLRKPRPPRPDTTH